MDMAALKLFCDLVETGSFTRAAERNFVSQSAVSQRLRALEHEYGQVLLDRGKGRGRVVPTEAGRILYEGGKALLAEAEELEARLRGLSEEIAGTVRVATVSSVGLHVLPGAVDVGIVACATERSGVEIVPFGDEEMVVVCAPEHPFAQESKLRLAQLEGQPFIAFADDIPTRHLVDERLRAAGAKVHILMAFDNIETIKNLVEIGSGVALLPADTVRREVREGLLASVPLAPSDSFRRPEGLLVKKAGVRRAAVRAFIAAMCSAK